MHRKPQEAAPAVSEGVRRPSSLDDPTCSQATTGWISGIQVRKLATFDKPTARSCLRAKQQMMRCDMEWWHANQNDQHEKKFEIYREVDKHMNFWIARSYHSKIGSGTRHLVA